MKRVLGLVICAGLVGGFLGTLFYGHMLGSASAAQHNDPVAIASPVDAAGNVKVHEQGTANVHITNASVPVSGTVNVGNLPSTQNVNVTNSSLSVNPPQGRVIPWSSPGSVSPQNYGFSHFVGSNDVSDCHSLTFVFANQGGPFPQVNHFQLIGHIGSAPIALQGTPVSGADPDSQHVFLVANTSLPAVMQTADELTFYNFSATDSADIGDAFMYCAR